MDDFWTEGEPLTDEELELLRDYDYEEDCDL